LVRQKDTIENVEFTHIISYKTSLFRSNTLSAKSTFSNSTSRSYALALYELGKDNDEINKIENEMESLKKLIIESSEFKEMISSPALAMEDKKNVIFAIADQNNFSQTLKKFLGFIAIKNRLFFLRNIIENFLSLISNNKGELKAKLVSSKKLSNDEKKKIENELSQDFKSPLKINYEYDPDLIAGLVIQVGSVMIDTSIKTKLKKIEKSMIGA
jgi:F-type H+-transporting ATPase subunit delta